MNLKMKFVRFFFGIFLIIAVFLSLLTERSSVSADTSSQGLGTASLAVTSVPPPAPPKKLDLPSNNLSAPPVVGTPSPSNGPTPTSAPVSAAQSQEPQNALKLEAKPALPDAASQKNTTSQDDQSEMKSSADEKAKEVLLKNYVMRISASNSNEVYPMQSVSFCLAVNKELYDKGYRCTARYDKSSFDNLNDLKDAKVDFVLTQADIQRDFLNGTEVFKGNQPYKKLRFVFSFQKEQLVLVVRADSKIKSLNDIQNKIVNIGSVGSSTKAMFDDLIKAKGWQYDKSFKSVTSLGPVDQIYALCNGEIDVMSLVAVQPNTILSDVSRMCQVTILDIVDTDLQNFIKSNSDYMMSEIQGGIYLGNPFTVKTIATVATVVSSTDIDENVVYMFVNSVMKNLNDIQQIHASLFDLQKNDMFQIGGISPLHAGSVKYLKENGYDLSKFFISDSTSSDPAAAAVSPAVAASK